MSEAKNKRKNNDKQFPDVYNNSNDGNDYFQFRLKAFFTPSHKHTYTHTWPWMNVRRFCCFSISFIQTSTLIKNLILQVNINTQTDKRMRYEGENWLTRVMRCEVLGCYVVNKDISQCISVTDWLGWWIERRQKKNILISMNSKLKLLHVRACERQGNKA